MAQVLEDSELPLSGLVHLVTTKKAGGTLARVLVAGDAGCSTPSPRFVMLADSTIPEQAASSLQESLKELVVDLKRRGVLEVCSPPGRCMLLLKKHLAFSKESSVLSFAVGYRKGSELQIYASDQWTREQTELRADGSSESKAKAANVAGSEQEEAALVVYGLEDDVDKHLGSRKVMRRRVSKRERQHILQRTGGICYLCKAELPPLSNWHVEHVIAFHLDPKRNDVMGNMLPACAKCNLRKGDRPLDWCMRVGADYSLATGVVERTDLSVDTRVRAALLAALRLKHDYMRASLQNVAREGVESLADATAVELVAEVERAGSACAFVAVEDGISSSGGEGELLIPEIPVSRLTGPTEVLGRGGQGVVTKMMFGDLVVAVKAVPVGGRRSAPELQWLRALSHPNIVKLYGFAYDDSPFGHRLLIVMELVEYELDSGDGLRLFWRNPVGFLFDLLDAVAYLHANSVMHRDVKVPNIRVTRKGRAKLLDFGIARRIEDVMTKGVGSKHYVAPEARGGTNYGAPADMWSLGKTVECIPRVGAGREGEIFAVQGEEIDFLESVQKRCMRKKPEDRPSARELMCEIQQKFSRLIARPETGVNACDLVMSSLSLSAAGAQEQLWIGGSGRGVVHRLQSCAGGGTAKEFKLDVVACSKDVRIPSFCKKCVPDPQALLRAVLGEEFVWVCDWRTTVGSFHLFRKACKCRDLISRASAEARGLLLCQYCARRASGNLIMRECDRGGV